MGFLGIYQLIAAMIFRNMAYLSFIELYAIRRHSLDAQISIPAGQVRLCHWHRRKRTRPRSYQPGYIWGPIQSVAAGCCVSSFTFACCSTRCVKRCRHSGVNTWHPKSKPPTVRCFHTHHEKWNRQMETLLENDTLRSDSSQRREEETMVEFFKVLRLLQTPRRS